MSEDEKAGFPAEPSETAVSSDEVVIEKLEPDSGEGLEQKLEQLATFSVLTVGTLLKMIEGKGPGALGPEGEIKLAKAREGVLEAITALDDWLESSEGQASDLDLAGLRGRLVQMAAQLEQTSIDDGTPPS